MIKELQQFQDINEWALLARTSDNLPVLAGGTIRWVAWQIDSMLKMLTTLLNERSTSEVEIRDILGKAEDKIMCLLTSIDETMQDVTDTLSCVTQDIDDTIREAVEDVSDYLNE